MKKVLLCKPLFYQINYQINPWMNIGSVNRSLAIDQWLLLKKEYEDLGLDVKIIDQVEGVPDMVFAADQGINVKNGFLISNFKYKQRQEESRIYENWLKQNSYKILRLPKSCIFEGGGESVFFKDILFVGTGFRTSPNSIAEITKVSNLNVIPLTLTDARFYHLDTCLFCLDDKTAFYYPPAFSKQSQDVLKKQVQNLIEINESDALNFAANSVTVGKNVFCQKGSSNFEKHIQKLGYSIIGLDVSEFIKAGGGIHCLSLFLPQ